MLRLKCRIREVRWERSQSTDTTDAEDLQHFREDTLSLARANLGHLAEIDRILFNFEAAELERRRAKCFEHLSHAEGPTGVGSGDTTLLMATHTPLEMYLSLLYKISPSRSQFPLPHLVIFS